MILNSTMSIGVLFPKNQNAALAVVCSGCNVSAFVFTFFNILLDRYPALTIHGLLFGYGVAQAICFVLGLILTPLRPFEQPQSTDMSSIEDGVPLFAKQGSETHAKETQTWGTDMARQICDVRYLAFVVFFCTLLLRMNVILVTNSTVLENMGDTDGTYAMLLEYLMPLGFVGNLTFGWICDRLGLLSAASILNLTGTIISALWMIPILKLQLVQLLLFCLYRCCIFTVLFVFIADYFGFRYFGILNGLATIAGGVANQTAGKAIARWSQLHEDRLYYHAHAWFTIAGGICAIVLACAQLSKSRGTDEVSLSSDAPSSVGNVITTMVGRGKKKST